MAVPEQRDPRAVERRIVSVLFADLVGFTPLSERLDPEDVATIQDRYFAATRETIERYGGVVEKFIGDAVMAVFGAPRSRDDDAERAVRAGLALVGGIEQLGAALGLEPGELQLRVGVNSGEVVHATEGPDAGRVTGDTVNTAARLQAAAEPGGVLIGDLTALAVAETMETELVGGIGLKGKADPVRTWRALGARAQPSRELALGALQAPMVGRDAELRRLRDADESARANVHASRVVVVAPPGVGKSRLLAEFATSLGQGPLRARVRPQATAPYETVAQLFTGVEEVDLEAALRAAGIPEGRSAVVREEVARLRSPGRGGGPPSGDLAVERDARFDAWLTALDVLAPGSAVWLVEDVHWAGGDLLAFLDRAGRAPTRHGRLVVATARPSLLDVAPDWCAVDRIDLSPLPPTDASELVRALLGDALPDRLLDAVVSRSDGTPLFIEELLRTWASVGTLVHTGGAWRLAVEPAAVTLPPTVQSIYAAQLDDLPPDARTLARRGSVAGRRVPIGALGALEIEGDAGLEVLRRRALMIGPVGDAVIGEAYAYRHALLRDAGYASLARAERSRLHLAMASWLGAVAGEAVDVVAEAIAEHHASALDSLSALDSSGLPSRAELAQAAADWYERAGEAALRLAAPEACCRLMERSIELTDEAATLELGRRRRRLGEVLSASADLDRGIAELEAALACCPEDPPSVAAAAYSLGRAYMQQIRFDEAERLTAETLQRLPPDPDGRRARLHALHAWAVSAQGRAEGVIEEAEAASAMARSARDPVLELEVLEHVAAARDEVGVAGDENWVALEERARDVGAWQQVVAAARARATYQAIDDPAAGARALASVAELARAHGQLEQAGWCELSRCELLWVVGRWDDSLALGRDVLDLAERNGYERLAFRTYVVLLPLTAARRDPTIAGRYATWAAASVAHLPTAPSPYARLLRAAIGVWTDEAHGRAPSPPAGELVDAVIPMINPHFVAAIESVVRAWVDAGELDAASAAADRVAEFAGEDDATPLMRASSALIGCWLGRTDAEAAVTAARDVDAPWWLARALRAAGRDGEAADIERSLGVVP